MKHLFYNYKGVKKGTYAVFENGKKIADGVKKEELINFGFKKIF